VSQRRILGLSFVCAVLLYGAVAHFIVRGGEAVSLQPALVAALYAVSLGALAAGLVVLPRLDLPGGFIVAMALCEVPAIVGLVLAILSKSPRDFYVLGGSSILALLYLTLKKDA
jgi:hypothetical protein